MSAVRSCYRPPSTARWCSGLTCRPVTAEIVSSNLIRVAKCGSSSVVEHNLAKVGVAGSSPVFRSIWRHSQAVRQRSAKPLSPVRFWVPPPYLTIIIFIYTCRGGGTGRRKGLKIPRIVRFVPVRFRSSAPKTTVVKFRSSFLLLISKMDLSVSYF